MKLTPMSQPVAPQQPQAPDKRAAAIAAFEAAAKPQTPPPQAQAQEHPVQNPSKVSPEETSVVMAKSEQSLDKNPITEDTSTPPEEPKAPEKDPEVVKQFAEIARQERILRAKAQKQQQELTDQRAALEAEKQALTNKAKEYEDGYVSKSKLKSDLIGTLEAEGYSYDEITQRVLNQSPKDPRIEAEMQALRDELKALRGGLDEAKQSTAKAQADAYQQALTQLKTDATKLIKDNPEFEAIDKTEAVQDVVDLIEQVYKKDGIVMSVQEAAQEVENYLVEESYNTVTRIDKIKKRLAEEAARTAAPKPVTQEDTKAKPEETPQMKTLTNNVSSTRKLSSRERAIMAMEGRLKS